MYVQKTNPDTSNSSLLVPAQRETPFNEADKALSCQILSATVGAAETVDSITIDGIAYTVTNYTPNGATITAANIDQLSAVVERIIEEGGLYTNLRFDGFDVETRFTRDATSGNVIGMAVGEPVISSITFSTAGATALTQNTNQYSTRLRNITVTQIDSGAGNGIKVGGVSVYAPAADLVAGTDTAADAQADLLNGLAAANADDISSHIDRVLVQDVTVSGNPAYLVQLWVRVGVDVAIVDNAADVAGVAQDGLLGYWYNN